MKYVGTFYILSTGIWSGGYLQFSMISYFGIFYSIQAIKILGTTRNAYGIRADVFVFVAVLSLADQMEGIRFAL